MNRHFRTFLLVIGGALLVGGSAVFAVGCKTIKNTGKTREFDLTGQSIKSFNFDCDTSNIEFIATTDSTMKIVYKESEKIFHTEEVKDNTLFIKQEDSLKWYERIFTFDFTPKKATIYLPTGAYEDLKVDNSTGDIKIPHDFSFNSVDITLSTGDIEFSSDVANVCNLVTSTGSVKLNNVATKTLFVHRSTGDLSMNKINVSESITIEGSTGETSLKEVRANSIDITSSTGDVELKDVKTTGNLKVDTHTGDIEFDAIDFEKGSMSTSTGDIEGTLATPKYVDAKSGTGKVRVDSDHLLTQTLTVTSSTGKIIITNK